MAENGILLCTFFSVLCVISASAQLPPKLPNIGYIGYGYNIFYGNPHCTDVFDPGFGQVPLFEFSYDKKQITTDGRWLIPDAVSVPGEATECSISGSSQTIQTAYDYQSSLSVDVTVEASGYGAAFSASSDYKQVSQDTSSTKDVFITTSATCQTYLVNLNNFMHPNYSDVFAEQGALLPEFFDPNNASMFWQFFDLFGTHFPTQIIFGSRWGYSFESTQAQYTSMQTAGIDITVAASYAGIINAGVTTESTYAQQMATSFSTLTFNTFEYGLGTPPPSSGDTQDWLTSSLGSEFMDPLQYALTNISYLFTPEYTQNLTLMTKFESVSAALAQYCALHLLPNGIVSTCDAPPVSPPVPVPQGFAVLACESTGGGGYDCGAASAALFDGLNAIQAQELIGDFCPGCVIVTSVTDAECFSLSIGDKGVWAEDSGSTNMTYVVEQSMDYCKFYGGQNCQPAVVGCATPPPAGAQWGAIACNLGCSGYNPTGEGYPDRLEAHQVALAGLKGGGFIAIDFYQCGAIARGSNGFVSVADDTPQDAEDAAMALCQQNFDNCNVLTSACVLPSNNDSEYRKTSGKYKATRVMRTK